MVSISFNDVNGVLAKVSHEINGSGGSETAVSITSEAALQQKNKNLTVLNSIAKCYRNNHECR